MKRLSENKARLLSLKKYILIAYDQGCSLRYLAEAYNSSPGSIRNLLIEEGVTMRKVGRPKKEKR